MEATFDVVNRHELHTVLEKNIINQCNTIIIYLPTSKAPETKTAIFRPT
jgi:hypothetical protein